MVTSSRRLSDQEICGLLLKAQARGQSNSFNDVLAFWGEELGWQGYEGDIARARAIFADGPEAWTQGELGAAAGELHPTTALPQTPRAASSREEPDSVPETVSRLQTFVLRNPLGTRAPEVPTVEMAPRSETGRVAERLPTDRVEPRAERAVPSSASEPEAPPSSAISTPNAPNTDDTGMAMPRAAWTIDHVEEQPPFIGQLGSSPVATPTMVKLALCALGVGVALLVVYRLLRGR